MDAPANGSRRRSLAFAFLLVVLGPLGASCMGHTHRIGLGPTGIGEESTRQFYILFGLIKINEVNVQRMAVDLTSYEIDTGYGLTDILLFPILLPFTVTSRTVTVYK